ncbi:beta-ketoacyl synthase N-terminal-like domain-containing protein [Streptomyces roseoverticillatus]|uniref:beta-ketoacyl synthase N-terminal-like domain-containing protein n=1 Tax=Streptomyces roseoverticillatus TaxID=66429 RepID=UPI0033F42850
MAARTFTRLQPGLSVRSASARPSARMSSGRAPLPEPRWWTVRPSAPRPSITPRWTGRRYSKGTSCSVPWRSWHNSPTRGRCFAFDGRADGYVWGEGAAMLVAAAVVAGALPLPDGVKVICRRARLLLDATSGAMASVLLSADDVERDLAEAGADQVGVAVDAPRPRPPFPATVSRSGIWSRCGRRRG